MTDGINLFKMENTCNMAVDMQYTPQTCMTNSTYIQHLAADEHQQAPWTTNYMNAYMFPTTNAVNNNGYYANYVYST